MLFVVTQITKIKLPARHSYATLKSPTALIKSASQILERTLNTARLPIKPLIHPPNNSWTQPLLPNVQPSTPTAPLKFAVTQITKIKPIARHIWLRNQPKRNVMLTSTTALLYFAPVMVKTLTTAKKSKIVIMKKLHALGLFASRLLERT
jgi:hypothetical protein